MATTIATISLTSSDLLSNAIGFSSSNALTTAGTSTGLSLTSGLARKTTVLTDTYTIYKADDYTADKANKIYLKNTETIAGRYFTVTIDDEVMGRLYAGDWAFFPWSATDGVKATFTATVTNAWDTGDTAVFDGVTITATGTTEGEDVGNVIRAAKYPNWVASGTADATAVTFTAKSSNYLGLIEEGAASDDWTVTTAGSGTMVIARGVVAVASANDIKITPSSTDSHTLEHMLFHE